MLAGNVGMLLISHFILAMLSVEKISIGLDFERNTKQCREVCQKKQSGTMRRKKRHAQKNITILDSSLSTSFNLSIIQGHELRQRSKSC